MNCTRSDLELVIKSANQELLKLKQTIKTETAELLRNPLGKDVGHITYLMIRYRDQNKRKIEAENLINKYHSPAAK